MTSITRMNRKRKTSIIVQAKPNVDTSMTNKSNRFFPSVSNIDFVLNQFESKQWVMIPTYQRQKDLWPMTRKVELIQTVFDQIPMPPIYLLDDGVTCGLFDGLQRMSTFLAFKTNVFSVPSFKIPLNLIELSETTDIFFKDFTAQGQRLFNSYSICYFTLNDLQNQPDFFQRLNFVLVQTMGERLHATNSVVAHVITDLLNQVQDRIVESHWQNESRGKVYERIAIILFLSDPLHLPLTTANLLNFVTNTKQIDPLIIQEILQNCQSQNQILERHLIPLLLSNNPKTKMYPVILSHPQLISKFNKLLKGNGKSSKSIHENIQLFNTLANINQAKMPGSDQLFKYQILESIKSFKGDDVCKSLLQTFQAHYQEDLERPVDDLLDSKCFVCQIAKATEWGFDGGLNIRQRTPISACKKCNKKLALCSVEEIRFVFF